MEITIPAIPAGVLTLLAFFSPLAVAVINHPRWPAGSKRLAAIVVSIALTALVLVVYYASTGDVIPQSPALCLLTLVVQQAAYALILKTRVRSIEGKNGVN